MNSDVAARFRYEAATADGRVVDGVLDAPSREMALGELRRRELFVIALDDAAPKRSAPRGGGRGGGGAGRPRRCSRDSPATLRSAPSSGRSSAPRCSTPRCSPW